MNHKDVTSITLCGDICGCGLYEQVSFTLLQIYILDPCGWNCEADFKPKFLN